MSSAIEDPPRAAVAVIPLDQEKTLAKLIKMIQEKWLKVSQEETVSPLEMQQRWMEVIHTLIEDIGKLTGNARVLALADATRGDRTTCEPPSPITLLKTLVRTLQHAEENGVSLPIVQEILKIFSEKNAMPSEPVHSMDLLVMQSNNTNG